MRPILIAALFAAAIMAAIPAQAFGFDAIPQSLTWPGDTVVGSSKGCETEAAKDSCK